MSGSFVGAFCRRSVRATGRSRVSRSVSRHCAMVATRAGVGAVLVLHFVTRAFSASVSASVS